MERLEKELLMRDLDKYGYSLVQTGEANTEDALTRMLHSNDGRVLEGLPVVLTNVLMWEHEFKFETFEKTLPPAHQRRFRTLAAITYFFLLWVPESEEAKSRLRSYLHKREPALLENVQHELNAGGTFNMGGGVKLDAQRLQNTYKNYVVAQLVHTEENLAKKLDEQRQATFLEALSTLFTERQRDLLFKLLNKASLSKTEREYYSRTVKPRLRALRNADLQSLASTLLGQ